MSELGGYGVVCELEEAKLRSGEEIGCERRFGVGERNCGGCRGGGGGFATGWRG